MQAVPSHFVYHTCTATWDLHVQAWLYYAPISKGWGTVLILHTAGPRALISHLVFSASLGCSFNVYMLFFFTPNLQVEEAQIFHRRGTISCPLSPNSYASCISCKCLISGFQASIQSNSERSKIEGANIIKSQG